MNCRDLVTKIAAAALLGVLTAPAVYAQATGDTGSTGVTVTLAEETKPLIDDSCADECPTGSHCSCQNICTNIAWLKCLDENCEIGGYGDANGCQATPNWWMAEGGDHSVLNSAQQSVAMHFLEAQTNCQDWTEIRSREPAPSPGCCGPGFRVCGCMSDTPLPHPNCGTSSQPACYGTAVSN